MNQKASELRALSESDLREELEATHRELFNVRFRLATRQIANSTELSKARRKIARIETLLRERTLLAKLPQAE